MGSGNELKACFHTSVFYKLTLSSHWVLGAMLYILSSSSHFSSHFTDKELKHGRWVSKLPPGYLLRTQGAQVDGTPGSSFHNPIHLFTPQSTPGPGAE